MVQTHDGSVANPNAGLLRDISPTEKTAVRDKLHEQLGYSVAPVTLGGDGEWKLVGARINQVGSANAAQAVYTHGDQTISVFSVPVGVLYGSDSSEGMTYSQVENGHPVSGFIHNGAVHCLVGSSKDGSLDLKTVTRLRNELRKSFPD